MTKHIVGFSGGIDSQACARWVLNRFPPADVILTNSNAGEWEDPLTVAFIEQYSASVHPVVVVNALIADMWDTPGFAETKGLDSAAPLTFEEMCRIKGRPPSRKAQFCTDILKLKPQRRWIREHFGPGGLYEGHDYIRYKGVRRDESNTRNPLYTMGFNRVGCAPCINSSKADILNWHARRPEMIDKVRGFEERTGLTFFFPVDRDGQINKIDEVVRWAGTSRGGNQVKLPVMLEREGCESKYGLCE